MVHIQVGTMLQGRGVAVDFLDAPLVHVACQELVDVQQLAPVVTDEERPYMERVYPSPFFFNSKALQRLHYITIQLTTIYRQQDPLFVNLLNNISTQK